MAERRRGVRLTPLAESDLEEIWRYTAETWSPDQADTYIRMIVAAFDTLAAGRRKGRSVPERAGYLKYAAGSHLVFYRDTVSNIDVIRILHQRMDVDGNL